MASRGLVSHQHLDRLLRGNHPANRYHWHHVLRVMEEVCAEPTAAHIKILRRVAVFAGRYTIHPRHGLPHAMPAEEMLRMLAVQALRRWHPTRHRDVIRHVLSHTEYDVVAHVARHASRA